MLTELFIDNFVIIKRDHIFFDQAFNVLTGETGSGKSLVLDAINLAMGKRASKEVIGKFSDKATVEAVFKLDGQTINKLRDKDIIFDDNMLIVTRTISEKSSSVRVNGRVVSLKFLQEISPLLIDIYNQRDSNKFLEAKNYIDILDTYENDKQTLKLRGELLELSRKKKQVEADFSKIDLTDEEVVRQKELIDYQIKEISQLNLEKIDEEKLDAEYKLLNNVANLKESLEKSKSYISSFDYGVITITSLMGKLTSELSQFEGYERGLDEIIGSSSVISEEIDNLYSDLDAYEEGLSEDPERLQILEDINEKLFDLKRKYGNSIEEILAFRDKMQERSAELDHISQLKENFKKTIDKINGERLKKAEDLHDIRLGKAKRLEEKIDKELMDLNIKNGKFKLSFTKSDLGDKGFDKLDFLIRTNKGEDLKSLSKTASGGELSRIMLAFKDIFSDYDKVDCLVFDEIDQGISGRSAQIVGEKILKISVNRQVIAVSHLPQIASLAQDHFLVKKEDKEDLTISQAKKLDHQERTQEIARLIGGVDITQKTLLSADEMLKMAEKLRRS